MNEESDIGTLQVEVVNLWLGRWLLLTCGTLEDFNAMTVGWGALGAMWGKPFVQVVVRPGRYTFEYLERYPTFTLCAFPERFRKALSLLGSRSGRDGDKIAASGLNPVASRAVAAPAYREAEFVLECRTIYWQDLEPANFLDEAIGSHYAGRDYHRIYYGEIVRAAGRPPVA